MSNGKTINKRGKQDNFYGDRSIVIPQKIIDSIKDNSLSNHLYLLNIGFYPHAKHHYRTRLDGAEGNILIYCTDGNGCIEIEDREFNILPNTFCVLPQNKAHAYWANPEKPWSIYWLEFAGNKSIEFASFYETPITIAQTSDARINDRITLFNELLTSLELGITTENISYANLMLNGLLASFFYIETYRSSKGYKGSDPIDRIIFYMQDNLYKNIKISDLAKLTKLSESHLNKIFRRKTGSSPLDYFINLKMQEAIRLLSNQSLQIKEVAYMLGYNDPFYFSRIFTKHIGMNPKNFTSTHKKKEEATDEDSFPIL